MEVILNALTSILASNPSYSIVFLICFLVVFALPSVLHYFAMKDVVTELKGSIDRLDDRLDKLVSFVLENLKIKQ